MADNVVLNSGSGGDTIAADDISNVKYQRVKLSLGADGTAVDAVAGNGVSGTGVQRVTIASDSTGVVGLNAGTNSVGFVGGTSYETVAASQTDQSLGATGASGDYLNFVLIVPATTSPGAVSIKDGSGSAITIFTGGASSVTNLIPFAVPIMAKSTGGAWKVTTGANVSCIGVGNFT